MDTNYASSLLDEIKRKKSINIYSENASSLLETALTDERSGISISSSKSVKRFENTSYVGDRFVGSSNSVGKFIVDFTNYYVNQKQLEASFSEIGSYMNFYPNLPYRDLVERSVKTGASAVNIFTWNNSKGAVDLFDNMQDMVSGLATVTGELANGFKKRINKSRYDVRVTNPEFNSDKDKTAKVLKATVDNEEIEPKKLFENFEKKNDEATDIQIAVEETSDKIVETEIKINDGTEELKSLEEISSENEAKEQNDIELVDSDGKTIGIEELNGNRPKIEIFDVDFPEQVFNPKQFKLKIKDLNFQGSDDDLSKIKQMLNEENDAREANYPKIGNIYVVPSNVDTLNGAKAIKIPLQNNLSVNGESRSAEYNSLSFLQRVGSVQQYVNTSSQTLELTTQYFVEARKRDNNTSASYYTMERLQKIQKMYEALVFPERWKHNTASEDNNSLSTYMLTRPPIINIAIGDDTTSGLYKITEGTADNNIMGVIGEKKLYAENGIINNFFTDVKWKDGSDSPALYHKSYIVTNVSIQKDMEKIPMHVEQTYNGKYVPLDYAGFIVTLSIVEIDPNYLGVMPTFNDLMRFATWMPKTTG